MAGLVCLVVVPVVVRMRGLPRHPAGTVWVVGLAVLVAQGVVPPAAAALKGSVIYDGVRQFLFAVPALAALATLGIAVAAHALATRRRLMTAVWVAVLVGLLVPVASSLRLFPYTYTWFNAPTAVQPVDGRWMVDYWRLSGRELTALLPSSGLESCALWAPDRGLIPCASLPQHEPFWTTRGSAGALPVPAVGEYAYIAPNRLRWEPPADCRETRTITRPLFGQEVTIGYAALCPVGDASE
jgi:hypothetical protein